MRANANNFDLVIAGGGINGAALARLAAFQGLRVALFESGDFGQGASSNTSKLLHGGLRYLETYDFALVHEAVRERAKLLSIAPHLAEERRFHFPIIPQGRHGRWLVKCGLLLYDGLSGWDHIGSHRWIGEREFQSREPGFLPGDRHGAYAYSDCVMDDARLCLENILDARALGAEVSNYRQLVSVQEEKEGMEITVLDRFTGREKVVTSEKVAFMCGPWSDQVAQKTMGLDTRWIRPSQGIHLVVSGLSAKDCLILPVPKSKRYFFVIPDDHGRHWVGTTETELRGDMPENPLPQAGEIREIQDLLALYFPEDEVELICTFAGIRPLARAEKGATAILSREHALHRIGDRMVAAVGGKYTTHRPLALDAYRHLYGKKKPIKSLKDRPLPGAWKSPQEFSELERDLRAEAWMTPALRQGWLRRYGMRSREVLAFFRAEERATTWRETLPGCPTIARGEMHFSLKREFALTAVDFFRRRTRAFFAPGGGLEALPEMEAALEEAFPGRSHVNDVHADYRRYLADYHHRSVRPERQKEGQG